MTIPMDELNFENAVSYHRGAFPPKADAIDYSRLKHELLKLCSPLGEGG
jgi:hypothetical protein